jgi:hypothetical protein
VELLNVWYQNAHVIILRGIITVLIASTCMLECENLKEAKGR